MVSPLDLRVSHPPRMRSSPGHIAQFFQIQSNHIPGVLSALQRCLLEAPNSVCDALDHRLTVEVLVLLDNLSLLLLGVLYGDRDACASGEGNGATCGIRRGFGEKVHSYLRFTR